MDQREAQVATERLRSVRGDTSPGTGRRRRGATPGAAGGTQRGGRASSGKMWPHISMSGENNRAFQKDGWLDLIEFLSTVIE